ncbi:MAG: hypothetical protein VX265_11855 [Myxococcota bacterium]|nr:hypothetical protein [Myxococcota bacterium]
MGHGLYPRAVWGVLLAGCVVRYVPDPAPAGQAPLPPPVDFRAVDARLGGLLADPLDVDQRDRLQAALTLSRKAKTDDAATQRAVLAYLQKVVAIEERSKPRSAPVLPPVPTVQSFVPIGADRVVEESLAGEEDAAPSSAGRPGAADGVAAFLAAADAGEFAIAVAAAEMCRDAPCWAEIEPRWSKVRDAHVAAERDRAGEAYLAARSLGDPAARLVAFEAVRTRLADLADRFPDAKDAEDVRRNVALVQREIEAQHAAVVERGVIPSPRP